MFIKYSKGGISRGLPNVYPTKRGAPKNSELLLFRGALKIPKKRRKRKKVRCERRGSFLITG